MTEPKVGDSASEFQVVFEKNCRDVSDIENRYVFKDGSYPFGLDGGWTHEKTVRRSRVSTPEERALCQMIFSLEDKIARLKAQLDDHMRTGKAAHR